MKITLPLANYLNKETGKLKMEQKLEKMKELEYAKKAVQSILDDGNCSVDFYGSAVLAYWAGVVERLREEIKNSL